MHSGLTIINRGVALVSRAAMLLILLGVAITFVEVVLRYVFNSPTTWAYKNTLWLGAIIYLVAGAYAMQRRCHIRITTFYNLAPPWLKIVFDYLTVFVIVVYATLMLVGGLEPAFDAFMNWVRSGQLLNPSISGTIKPLVLIMTVVVVILAISNLLTDHCGSAKRKPRSDTETN